MEPDEAGMLGKLPRSRPGRRSEKRAGTPPDRARTSTPPSGRARESEPLADALSFAGSLAGAGVRTGAALTRGLLRRLPRP
jgi:hypothetical protein